jgi:hypothetical protein
MRWSTTLAAIGVVAGAVFAVHDEAQTLLEQCEPQSLDWYARMLVLAALFSMHSLVLSAGAYSVLLLGDIGEGFLKRTAEIAYVVLIAVAVGFLMAIADPILNYLVAASCSALDACIQPGIAQSLLRGANAATAWPNTPVAVFMVTLFGMGAFVVQDIARRERNALARRGVA